MEITGHIYGHSFVKGKKKPRAVAWWHSACLACVKALSSVPKTTKRERMEYKKGGRKRKERKDLK